MRSGEHGDKVEQLCLCSVIKYDVVSEAMAHVRACEAIPPEWKQRIEEDVRRRR